ncbi:thioredoxin domain-containing protein [Bacteroides sp.]|uniref:vitamin K epoxide reductase family protein n=1 Tax=Bacteroides sp. TaxID=29523 RepID=UPI00258ADFC0|nr:thioredoxin domain-containing protein [Bacteroides sp.]
MKINIFISFLELLGVKHTVSYSSRFFNEHPHKYSLYGLSSMLTDYGIDNAGVKITDKTSVSSIKTPFIAHIGSDFVIVEKTDSDKIRFIQSGKRITVSPDVFNKMWTGYLLVAEPDETSGEPGHKKHRRQELFHVVQKATFLLIILALSASAFISNGGYLNLEMILLWVINFVGAYTGYLLVLKNLHIQSDYADKICSLFKHNDCNDVLESEAAKLFGILGWGEVGFGYFSANLFILSFLPELTPCLAFVNVCVLPYSFWSVWYQKIKAKQWCPLCLLVMLLLWGIFLTCLFSGYINVSSFTLVGLLLTGSIYLLFVLGVNMCVAAIAKGLGVENARYEINSIKANEDVFNTLLKQQPRYEVTKSSSQILLGDPSSDILVTVFSNPHCTPCAKMHKRINELLAKNDRICVQYIFSSFNKDLDISSKYLIGIYLQKNGLAKHIFDKWFEEGKFRREEFFRENPVAMDAEEVNGEFESHEKWKEQTGLQATPTVLVNGYKLPDNFKIEDMLYFLEMET